MADVFISYHEKSAGELAAQIADALNAAGISCWYARRNLQPGAIFSDDIPQAIRNCKVFLLVLNEGSNQSEHVKNELNLAFRRVNRHEQITLIPFQVDNCAISDSIDFFINRFQVTKGAPPNEQNIQILVEKIANTLGKKSRKSKPHSAVGHSIIVCPSCGCKMVPYGLFRARCPNCKKLWVRPKRFSY